MSQIDMIVNRFEKEKITLANLMMNETPTPITIEYEPETITINNLEEDLPPFICIWRHSKRVEGSIDQTTWLPFNEHESKELQIYRLLDPVSVLPHVHIKKTIEASPKTFLIQGSYKIENLELPPILVDHFKKEENLQRWIKLQSWDNQLLTMSQQDFPPYGDTITLFFRAGRVLEGRPLSE